MNKETNENQITFYRCNVCGNLMIKLNDSGITPQCCGRDMVQLSANITDGVTEKHKPVWMMDGCKLIVQVGSENHPMTKDHYIQWIVVKTNHGFHARQLTPDNDPSACFKICKGEEIQAVYEYCNIHGLWKTDKSEEQYEYSLCGI